jgi:hypothetical protein
MIDMKLGKPNDPELVAIDSIHREPILADAINREAGSSKTTWVIDYWFLFHLFDSNRCERREELDQIPSMYKCNVCKETADLLTKGSRI